MLLRVRERSLQALESLDWAGVIIIIVDRNRGSGESTRAGSLPQDQQQQLISVGWPR